VCERVHLPTNSRLLTTCYQQLENNESASQLVATRMQQTISHANPAILKKYSYNPGHKNLGT